MKELLIIDEDNSNILETIGEELAGAYKVAFAGSPWYERSQCLARECQVSFSGQSAGEPCAECNQELVEAYDSKELVSSWRTMVDREDALMLITIQAGRPLSATIARPTTGEELYERKYTAVPAMRTWISQKLPSGRFVWIEDTFANRELSPKNNMKNRASILGNIALRYDGLSIVTRTLSPAVVRSTLRDIGTSTTMYIGTEGVGQDMSCQAQTTDRVPDTRTMLVVDNERLRS